MSYDANGNRRARLSRQNTFGENQHYTRDINISILRPTLSTRVTRRADQPRQPYLPEIRLEQHTQRNNEPFQVHHNLIHRAATESNAHQFLTVQDFESSARTRNSKVVKSQRSCESYDSAASGMSWSSSQSTSAMHMRGSGYHSNSMSSNHSVSGFEDAPYNDRPENTFTKSKNIESTPTFAQRNIDESYLTKGIYRNRTSGRPLFKTGSSFDDETDVRSAITAELNNLQPSFDVAVPDQREVTEVAETGQKNIESTSEGLEKLESDQRKRTKSFWKKALDLIRISKTTEGKQWKRFIKKRSEDEEERKSSSPEEIDPIYLLLKSAANRHKLLCSEVGTKVVNLKSACDHDEEDN